MKLLTTSVALCIGLISATAANAALISELGGQAVYDTNTNLTWAANASLSKTDTFGLATGVNLGTDSYGHESVIYGNGSMSWGGAQKWIDAMNAANYLGYTDWRLPTVKPVNGISFNYTYSYYDGSTDYGYNISAPGTVYEGSKGNEMAYLYYNSLGNAKNYYLTNTGPFINLQPREYWSGTQYAPNYQYTWAFDMSIGLQHPLYSVCCTYYESGYAMAVRDGDVTAAPVPAAAWLLGSGLLGLIGVARRKAA